MGLKRITQSILRVRKRSGAVLVALGILLSIFGVAPGLVEKKIPFGWSPPIRNVFDFVLGWSLVAGICAASLFTFTYLAEWLVGLVAVLNKNMSNIQRALERTYRFLMTPRWTYRETLHLLGSTGLTFVLLASLTRLQPPDRSGRYSPGTALHSDEHGEVRRAVAPKRRVAVPVKLTNNDQVWWRSRFLCQVDADDDRGEGCTALPIIPPGESEIVSISLLVPETPGSHTAHFKLVDSDGIILHPDLPPVRLTLQRV